MCYTATTSLHPHLSLSSQWTWDVVIIIISTLKMRKQKLIGLSRSPAMIQFVSVWLQRDEFARTPRPSSIWIYGNHPISPHIHTSPKATSSVIKKVMGSCQRWLSSHGFIMRWGFLWDSTTGCFSNLFNSSIMLWSHLLFYIGQM